MACVKGPSENLSGPGQGHNRNRLGERLQREIVHRAPLHGCFLLLPAETLPSLKAVGFQSAAIRVAAKQTVRKPQVTPQGTGAPQSHLV